VLERGSALQRYGNRALEVPIRLPQAMEADTEPNFSLLCAHN